MKFLALYIVTFCIFTVVSVPNRPPAIYIQPNDRDVYYKVGETVEMPCIADGVPTPIYRWTRNKVDFNPSGNDDRMVQLPNEGTIVINRPEDKDEGIFQCNALNEHGTSVSVNVNLRQAMLEDFPYGAYQTVHVLRGHSVKLDCIRPTSIPKADIKWVIKSLKDNGKTTPINLNKRMTMDLEGRLYITKVEKEDEKEDHLYMCMATNYFMRRNTYSSGYKLITGGSGATDDLVNPHLLWSTPLEVFGLLGDDLQIKCIYGGNPIPEVHWDGPGRIPYGRRTLSQGGQELRISRLNESDGGSYTCYTTSSSGNREQRNINIILKSRPTWVLGPPQDVEAAVGAEAEFLCLAKGNPSPEYKWYINGVPIEDTTHPTYTKSGRFFKPNDNLVRITNLQKSDVMVLQCNASNSFGYVFADFYLNVLKERPQFIKRPIKNLKVAEATDVELTCQTSGKPDPIVTWFRGTQQITGGRYQILPNGDLFITSIVLSDAGNYSCTAENEEGKTSDWGELIVRRQTRIEMKPSDLENTAGTDAKFTCSGTTDFEEVANLEVYWEKDRKRITTIDQRMTTNVQDNSLTISGTISRDSGLYTCVVTNGLDSQRADAILTVKDKPEPPVDIKTRDCINWRVTLEWTKGAVNNAPIQYFTIQFNTSMEPDNWVFARTANASQSSITLNLNPGVSYSWRVLATNKIGISDPSKGSEICTTQAAKPFKNPENVRGMGDKPNYLVIEWTPMPPIEQGGNNFRYILSISRPGNTVDIVKPISDWRIFRYEHLTNDIYIPYNVSVKAANEYGDSSALLVTHVIYSGENLPSSSLQITDLVVDDTEMEDNAATFYWSWNMKLNNDPQSGLSGKFRGFKFQYWVKDRKQETFREDEILERDLVGRYGAVDPNSVTELKYTLTNLLPYTYMEAQICVMNTHYVGGPPSPIVGFVTSRGVPGPVLDLTPVVIGSNFIEITWKLPELLNSPTGGLIANSYIRGFDVGFQTVDGLDLGKMQEMDPQINEANRNRTIVNGLTKSQKYRIHMWARTENGRGEDSFIEITTKPSSALVVPAFNIININSTFFNVTWREVSDKRYGTVVYVEYRKKGVSDWQQSPQEVSKSWLGIANLETGTEYEVRLAVTNGDDSNVSDDIEIVETKGLAAAYSLGSNIGWFIGLLISVLVIIGIAILIVLLYKRRPEPKQRPYTAPPRKREDYGFERSEREYRDYPEDRGYHDDDRYRDDYNRGYEYDDEKHRYDDGDDYDRRRYDDGDRYDDYDKRYSDYDRRYDDDDYDRRNDDDYDRYDDDKRRYSDYDDKKRYSDYDDKKRQSDYNEKDHYGEDDYEPYSRRPDYDRTPSYDQYRPPSYNEEVDMREPSKFDADGYPIETKPATPKTPGTSSFV